MGVKVIRCPACNTFYNGADYEECPYCAKNKKKQPAMAAPAAKKPEVSNEAEKPVETARNAAARPGTDSAIMATRPLANVLSGGTGMSSDHVTPQDMPQAAAMPRQIGVSQIDEPVVNARATDTSLSGRIESVGKTTAKFVSVCGSEVVHPVVGWLVCVKGVYYGKSFPLKNGINNVGRNEGMEVPLLKDLSVSSQPVVRIIYDSKGNLFNAMPGQSNSSLCYVNGNAIYERTVLNGFEEIELGDTEENKFVFVPFCGNSFRWSDHPNKKES